MKYPTAEQVANARDRARNRLLSSKEAETYAHDTKLYQSMDDWVNAANSTDPEGTMRLGVNLKTSHHLSLQIAAQERGIKMADLVQQMVEQLPEYQRIYGEKS